MDRTKTLAALGVVAALAMPAAALAKNDHGAEAVQHGGSGHGADHGRPAKKPKVSTYVFTGLVAGVGDGTVQVDVRGGNSRGRTFKGQTLTFSVADAKLKVRDVNGDGKRDLGDVAADDRVAVQAKLPRGAVDASQPLPARHLLDKGPVKAQPDPAENEDETDDAPQSPPTA